MDDLTLDLTTPDRVPEGALRNIQALLFTGWQRLPWSAFLFVRFADEPKAARAWLRDIQPNVAWSDELAKRRAEASKLQIALTPDGLRKLGLALSEIDGFPQELKEGLQSRSALLGAAPEDEAMDLRGCDALVLVYAKLESDLEDAIAKQQRLVHMYAGTVIVRERASHWQGCEPFGFAYGISQPSIRSERPSHAEPHEEIAAGDLVLGYRNSYGQTPAGPTVHDADGKPLFDLARDGTYLVFWKLEQDVGAFWQTFMDLGRRYAGQVAGVPDDAWSAAKWLASRAMGRWPSGQPLALQPERSEEVQIVDDFTYDDDPDGLRCPHGAHARRARPRIRFLGERHRILRRSRAYGTLMNVDDILDRLAARDFQMPEPTGLLFMSLQANLAHGFEMIQRARIDGPCVGGTAYESDPIMGHAGRRFTVPTLPIALHLGGVSSQDTHERWPRFVTPRGGGYFFMPSRKALDYLGSERS